MKSCLSWCSFIPCFSEISLTFLLSVCAWCMIKTTHSKLIVHTYSDGYSFERVKVIWRLYWVVASLSIYVKPIKKYCFRVHTLVLSLIILFKSWFLYYGCRYCHDIIRGNGNVLFYASVIFVYNAFVYITDGNKQNMKKARMYYQDNHRLTHGIAR